MNPLTKEQVRSLSPGQQETIGILQARRVKKRQQLLESAHSYRGKVVVPVVLILGVIGLYYFHAPTPVLVAVGVVGFWTLLQFHVTGLNRRLDSLMVLLEPDNKIRDDDAA